MRNNKILSLAAGVIISFTLLVCVFYKVNFHEFIYSLKSINNYSLLFCTLFICFTYIAKAVMWRVTTKPMKQVSTSTLFGGVVVGYMINGILPFRAGDIFRAHYLSSKTGLRRTTVLSTIFIERIMDINSLGLLLAMSLFLGIHGISQRTAAFIFLLWLAIMAVAYLLIINSKKLERKKHTGRLVPKRLLEIINNFLTPLNQLREIRKIVYLLILSMISWAINYASLFALVYYSGAMMKFEAALLLFLFVNIGFLIPAAPGSLGVMQLAFWLSLSQFGVAKEQALALSFAYLFLAYIFNTSVGLPYFIQAHLWDQRKVVREEQQP